MPIHEFYDLNNQLNLFSSHESCLHCQESWFLPLSLLTVCIHLSNRVLRKLAKEGLHATFKALSTCISQRVLLT